MQKSERGLGRVLDAMEKRQADSRRFKRSKEVIGLLFDPANLSGLDRGQHFETRRNEWNKILEPARLAPENQH